MLTVCSKSPSSCLGWDGPALISPKSSSKGRGLGALPHQSGSAFSSPWAQARMNCQALQGQLGDLQADLEYISAAVPGSQELSFRPVLLLGPWSLSSGWIWAPGGRKHLLPLAKAPVILRFELLFQEDAGDNAAHVPLVSADFGLWCYVLQFPLPHCLEGEGCGRLHLCFLPECVEGGRIPEIWESWN